MSLTSASQYHYLILNIKIFEDKSDNAGHFAV